MYYETDSSGNLVRALPGYYGGYHADLEGADDSVLSDTQRDYLNIDLSRIVLVEDSAHKLFICKASAVQEVSQRCVDANYKILPQYKRDNIYAGSPASDNYPLYLQGNTGRATIAALNAIYQQIAAKAHAAINNETITTCAEVDVIMAELYFPKEAEIITQLGVG